MQLDKTASALQLGEALKADHATLETEFHRALCAVRGGDPEYVRSAWLSMDADLQAHLHAEEEFILPGFEQSHPQEAAHIRRDHGEIRRALEQLGIELDLHMLRCESAEAFVASLRSHAQYEEQLFYDWAERQLPEAQKRSVLDRLRAWRRGHAHEQEQPELHAPG